MWLDEALQHNSKKFVKHLDLQKGLEKIEKRLEGIEKKINSYLNMPSQAPGVAYNSIIDWDPSFSRADYASIYPRPPFDLQR